MSCVGLIVWSSSSLPPLDRVENPDKALERLTSRSLEFEYALAQTSSWEQQLNHWLSGGDDVLEDAIGEYRELVDYSKNSLSKLYLGVLEAEAGRHDEVHQACSRLAEGNSTLAPIQQVTPSGLSEKHPSNLGSILPPFRLIWRKKYQPIGFIAVLAIHLAKKENDAAFELVTREQLDQRASQLLRRNRILLLTQIGVCVIGMFLMGAFIRRQASGMQRIHEGRSGHVAS